MEEIHSLSYERDFRGLGQAALLTVGRTFTLFTPIRPALNVTMAFRGMRPRPPAMPTMHLAFISMCPITLTRWFMHRTAARFIQFQPTRTAITLLMARIRLAEFRSSQRAAETRFITTC